MVRVASDDPPEPTSLPAAPVADRVSRGLSFWRSIASPSDYQVLRWIRFGYELEWESGPCPPSTRPNQRSATENAEFVDEQIDAMLHARAIQEVPYRPHCCNPLGVVTKLD